MDGKIAVVTGSNKDIGYAIVKKLCKRGVGTVYLTARDVNKGIEAVENLKTEGLNPEFHQLEVTDEESVKKFAYYLKQQHGGIDILINNAGVAPADMSKTTYKDAKRVIDTNYRSILTIQEHLFPILNDNARVVNIASDCGHISNLKNTYWIERLTKKDIKVEDVNAFIEWFLDCVKNGTLKENDFEAMQILSYKISKVALCALTRVQQNEIGRGISINSIHPGFVQTDMTGNYGELTLDQSGEAPVYVALDVEQSVKGRYFWYDKTEKDWSNPNINLSMHRKELQNYLKKINFFNQ
ncbi:carbonyl reductase [NADPH] 1-like [Pectinophora gossypiella]|uniref:carbonyl reductase [NADPH] 1-like n=1 Tax=Pectinophora gossypiella TaxID=13191 RepID=UPI00214EE4B9|nr:carbonyl reductase [NADPH] 1-like [Pectinophora gossypiella]